MITYGYSFQNETVAETSREPDPHPSARHCSGILLGCDRIVERPVQVTEWNVDSHLGNRQLRLAQFWLAQFWLPQLRLTPFRHTR